MSKRFTVEELAKLREIAEAATPGPWEVYGPDYGSEVMQHATGVCAEDEYGSEFDICRAPGERDEAAESADMEYIAALDPATVLAMLDEIECLRAKIKRLRREREVLAEAVMAREQARNVEGMAHGAMVQSLTEQLKVDQWRRLAQENDLKAHEAALALLDGEKGGGGA